jgi:hypothetical protein
MEEGKEVVKENELEIIKSGVDDLLKSCADHGLIPDNVGDLAGVLPQGSEFQEQKLKILENGSEILDISGDIFSSRLVFVRFGGQKAVANEEYRNLLSKERMRKTLLFDRLVLMKTFMEKGLVEAGEMPEINKLVLKDGVTFDQYLGAIKSSQLEASELGEAIKEKRDSLPDWQVGEHTPTKLNY